MRYAYHADAEVFSTFDAAHAQNQYPNLYRSGLRIGGPRWAALLRQWCQRNGVVYREFRTGQDRRKRSKAPGRIDMSKPAFVMAGLTPAPAPIPERPGAPRTSEQIAAFEAAELAVAIAKAISDYRRSKWRRPLKKHQPHGFRIGPGQKVQKFYGATIKAKAKPSGSKLRQQLNGLPSEERWQYPHDLSAGWRERE